MVTVAIVKQQCFWPAYIRYSNVIMDDVNVLGEGHREVSILLIPRVTL